MRSFSCDTYCKVRGKKSQLKKKPFIRILRRAQHLENNPESVVQRLFWEYWFCQGIRLDFSSLGDLVFLSSSWHYVPYDINLAFHLSVFSSANDHFASVYQCLTWRYSIPKKVNEHYITKGSWINWKSNLSPSAWFYWMRLPHWLYWLWTNDI